MIKSLVRTKKCIRHTLCLKINHHCNKYFHSKRQPRIVLSENICHFVNLLSFASSSFFLSMRKIMWLNSQQPKTRRHVEHPIMMFEFMFNPRILFCIYLYFPQSLGCQIDPVGYSLFWLGNGICSDNKNIPECLYDGGDCCSDSEANFQYCSNCTCIETPFEKWK